MKLSIKILLPLIILVSKESLAQKVTVREEKVTMTTYMFSDPNPIPDINRIYPYVRFDGYTNQAKEKAWNMVIMENDYIKLWVCPDIGGKVWGAIEKSTGKEFLYYNEVVKFRDVAMRGAWTSGGLEYNFGDIGHIPTCATPVDYTIKEHSDGSVSCVVGAIDLPSRTEWNVEITLPADKAYFTTTASWLNPSSLPVTYYHWMNAAAKASGDLEFIYPGNKRIGHGGEVGEWPYEHGRHLALYEKNNFGVYKSYHVMNAYADFFGGYWHEDDFGFGRYSRYDEKPGKKIWIWGLSDQGMIWEDLLTDSDGQYVEYQSGKLFNQAASSSTFTPFKHREFSPHDADVMTEYWFPLKETGGMDAASPYAVLKVDREGDRVQIVLSALQKLESALFVTAKESGEEFSPFEVRLDPLEQQNYTLTIPQEEEFELVLGDHLLTYSSDLSSKHVDRPIDPDPTFNWESAYGWYTLGLEQEKQREYIKAEESYRKCLEKDAGFLPALNRMALSFYRKMEDKGALEYATKALAIDTYDGLANYVYGLINKEVGATAEAKSGFSIATQSVAYRSAAFTELAKMHIAEGNVNEAKIYADQALTFNKYNLAALEVLALAARLDGDEQSGKTYLATLEDHMPVHPFLRFEQYQWGTITKEKFTQSITNELPHESYLELALTYLHLGQRATALEVLTLAPSQPIVQLWKAYLDMDQRENLLTETLEMSVEMVLPHRVETAHILESFKDQRPHWKLSYYLSLIYWNKGRIAETKQLFQEIGDQADVPLFYLAKAKLFEEDQEIATSAINMARTLAPDDWRVQLASLTEEMKQKDQSAAVVQAEKMVAAHPEKSVFGLIYAKALLAQKEYGTAISFLENYVVLPYEGATDGRNVYHEVCIRRAYEALKESDYEEAVQYAEKAKVWPINLGVGKPYEVDERLDDFVLARAYENMGEQDKAERYYAKVMNHETPSYLRESSKLYLQAWTLKEHEQSDKAEMLIEKAIEKEKNNASLRWVKATFLAEGNQNKAEELAKRKEDISAYDTRVNDQEFDLLLDLLELEVLK